MNPRYTIFAGKRHLVPQKSCSKKVGRQKTAKQNAGKFGGGIMRI